MEPSPASDGYDHDKALRERSGEVDIDCRVTSFLYELMRDRLPPGEVESILRNSIKQPTRYTNGFLARYAEDCARRLIHGQEGD